VKFHIVRMVPIPKPTLQRIPVDAPIEEFIEAITKDGGCICTDFATPEDIAAANAEVKPFLDADKPWQVGLTMNIFLIFQLIPKPRGNSSHQKLDAAIGFYGGAQLVERSFSCTHCSR
jgi:hypothetical protein